MLFDRYGELLARLEEMGARVGELNNRDRQVMQSLLEEQEWLSATLVKRARFLLEEIDRSFEKLFDWMIAFSDLIDRASGHGGTPADVLRVEKMMQEADDLREQLNRLIPDRGTKEVVPFAITLKDRTDIADGATAGCEKPNTARREAAPAFAGTEITAEVVPPFLFPADNRTIKMQPAPPPVAVIKKAGRKNRKKKKNADNGPGYVPPVELLSALEQKMAAACTSKKHGRNLHAPK